jgi:uncharacterized protein (TIGR00369 family)
MERRIAPVGQIPLHWMLGLEFDPPVRGTRTAQVRMPIAPEAFGFTQNLHGGAIATMVDLACALAATAATDFDPQRESLVTADMHIRYVGRPKGALVFANAEVLRVGSQLIVIECRVVDADDHLIAVADFSMMRVTLRRPLSDN